MSSHKNRFQFSVRMQFPTVVPSFRYWTYATICTTWIARVQRRQNHPCNRHRHIPLTRLNPRLMRLSLRLTRLNPQPTRLSLRLMRLNPRLMRLNLRLMRLNPRLMRLNLRLTRLNLRLISQHLPNHRVILSSRNPIHYLLPIPIPGWTELRPTCGSSGNRQSSWRSVKRDTGRTYKLIMNSRAISPRIYRKRPAYRIHGPSSK